jgi:hypothetical protein
VTAGELPGPPAHRYGEGQANLPPAIGRPVKEGGDLPPGVYIVNRGDRVILMNRGVPLSLSPLQARAVINGLTSAWSKTSEGESDGPPS